MASTDTHKRKAYRVPDKPALEITDYTGWRSLLNPLWCYHGFRMAVVGLTCFGLIMVFYTVFSWKMYVAPSGYATIVVLISFMFAVLFVIVGIIGEYIAILFAEIKDRPVYIVKDTANVKKNRSKDTDGQDVR